MAKQPFAREALVRISKMFELDARFRNGNPPSKVKELRREHLKPLLTEFFQFAEVAYEMHKAQRGSLRSALGYCVRQQEALCRFLEDGRLRMDNNLSEGELRKVVRIRDAALFAGSDEHAQAAGHILSLIASARLHNLDPEVYLRELILVLPYWPKDRYLELAPKFWATTRASLNLTQLTREAGYIDLPDITPDSPCAQQEQPAATVSTARV